MTDMNTDYRLDSKSLPYKVEILTLDTKFFEENSFFSSRVEVDLRIKFEKDNGQYAILFNKFGALVDSRVETADLSLDELEVEESTLDIDELYNSLKDSKILLTFTS